MSYRLPAILVPLVLAACNNASTISPTTAPATLTQSPRAATADLPPFVTLGQAQPTATHASPTQSTPINCTSPAPPTLSQTEGPYYKAGSPERASLWAQGMAGTKLVLTGYVLTTDCKPITRALLDFWQADANGDYDNSGYTLRGHQFTDASGWYQLTTVIPGLYTGRTAHIHFKVQAPNGPVITSQLYFPGIAQNQRDSIFNDKLVVASQNTNAGMAATFNFVANTK